MIQIRAFKLRAIPRPSPCKNGGWNSERCVWKPISSAIPDRAKSSTKIFLTAPEGDLI